VQRVGGEREGVVGRGAAANEEQRVARVLAELGIGGDRGRGGGEGAEEVMVVGGRDDAAAAPLAAEEEAREEDVPHRGRWAARRGRSERLRGGVGDVDVMEAVMGGGGWTAPTAATAADRDGRRFRSEGFALGSCRNDWLRLMGFWAMQPQCTYTRGPISLK